jgi:hypothetical protein
MPLMTTICPHCNLVSANSQVCTNLGCGKRIADSVQLFARSRRSLRSVPPKIPVRRTASQSHPSSGRTPVMFLGGQLE